MSERRQTQMLFHVIGDVVDYVNLLLAGLSLQTYPDSYRFVGFKASPPCDACASSMIPSAD